MSLASFKFRLQAVLDWRQAQDETAQRVLGAARQALSDAEAALAATETRLDEARARTRDADRDASDPHVRTWHWNWIAGCQDEMRQSAQRVQQQRAAVDQASLAAQVARRGLRTLERLRQRALDTHQYQQHRLEQQALDALAASRFVRRDTTHS